MIQVDLDNKNDKEFFDSGPCTSSLSTDDGDQSITSSSSTSISSIYPDYSVKSLIINSVDGVERTLKTVPAAAYSMPKLERRGGKQQQAWLNSECRVPLLGRRDSNHGQQEKMKKKWEKGTTRRLVRSRRCREYDYLVMDCNSLVEPEIGTQTQHVGGNDPCADGTLIRLSCSSPLGFNRDDNGCQRGIPDKNIPINASTPLLSREVDEGDFRTRHDQQENTRTRRCNDHNTTRKESIDGYGWTSLCSLPTSSNPPPPTDGGLTTAESLPVFSEMSELQCGNASSATATLTPVESDSGGLLQLSNASTASCASSRRSLRCASGGGSTVRQVNVQCKPRRPSQGRKTPSMQTTPVKHGLSQPPPQQKQSTCSLMMVSPDAVSRSPSQQWRNSSGNCIGLMPTSSQCASLTAVQPVHQPEQCYPQTTITTSTITDHRNIPPTPASGGLHNPLYNVSNEFMRVAGYTQQFKRLLSKRTSCTGNNHHDTTGVVFAGDIRGDTDIEKGNHMPSTIQSINNHEANEQAVLGRTVITGDGFIPSPAIIAARRVWDTPKGPNGDIKCIDPRRQSRKSAYGRLWKEQPNFKHRLKKRKHLFSRRTRVSDFALLFALTGILLTILEAELTASGTIAKTEHVSRFLRSLIVLTSLVLLCLIVCYHAIETQISVIDSGADDWRVAITNDRIRQCALEVIVCSVCPFPVNVSVTWDRLKQDHRTPYPVLVPLDAVLSVPMFLRFYLFGRFMALHSRQFQDAATRSIAALNHIAVNFAFVLKTLMYEHPLRVLILFTVCFWVAMSWILTQCERYVSGKFDDEESNHYLNSIWFIIITFMSIGYGDIVPNTYCGRALAITTGIVGAGVSSALIAVISRKLELSRAEKHVNQFMTDSKLMRQRKEAAAAVLQHTWFIHKYKNIPKAKDDMKLRMHQRRFLASINEFRRVKWDQRKLAEQGNALVDVAKLQSEMHETLWDMQQNQDHLVAQMGVLMQKVQELQDVVLAQYLPQQPCIHERIYQTNGIGENTPNLTATSTDDHPSQFVTPIVIAQHVESLPASRQNSYNDDDGGTVML